MKREPKVPSLNRETPIRPSEYVISPWFLIPASLRTEYAFGTRERTIAAPLRGKNADGWIVVTNARTPVGVLREWSDGDWGVQRVKRELSGELVVNGIIRSAPTWQEAIRKLYDWRAISGDLGA